MSSQLFNSGAPAPSTEDFINSVFNGMARRITSGCPSPIPDPDDADPEPQEASTQVEISRIFNQLGPKINQDVRNALTMLCNDFARACSRADALHERGVQLRAGLEENIKRLGVYCECFAVANGKVADQDRAISRLTDEMVDLDDASSEEGRRLQKGVKEAQEKLAWLAADCGGLFTKVYDETNAVLGKKAEIRMGESERRQLRLRALALKTKAMAVARGEWVPTPEEMPGMDYMLL